MQERLLYTRWHSSNLHRYNQSYLTGNHRWHSRNAKEGSIWTIDPPIADFNGSRRINGELIGLQHQGGLQRLRCTQIRTSQIKVRSWRQQIGLPLIRY